jgi:hypothetical protein
MPVTQTATTISAAVTASGAGAATKSPVNLEKAEALLRCVTSVTGAATVTVEGRNVKGLVATKETPWRQLASFTTDNTLATRVLPLDKILEDIGGTLPDQFRVNTTAYTAGTHTVSLLTHAV